MTNDSKWKEIGRLEDENADLKTRLAEAERWSKRASAACNGVIIVPELQLALSELRRALRATDSAPPALAWVPVAIKDCPKCDNPAACEAQGHCMNWSEVVERAVVSAPAIPEQRTAFQRFVQDEMPVLMKGIEDSADEVPK